jgi:hypothetical protein
MFFGYLGYVEATDEEAAIEAAAKQFNVTEAHQSARRRAGKRPLSGEADEKASWRLLL